jgi:glycerol-3-phosphate dehydrogenase (NAD(P)+)
MSPVTVLGAGSWGTTMAQVLADAGNDVLVWGRNDNVVVEINSSHTNIKYIPGIVLPSQLRATSNIREAMSHSSTYVLAIPAQTLRYKLEEWNGLFAKDGILISTVKGIEVSSHFRMTEVIIDVLGVDADTVGIITGPNLANELALRQPAAAVAAATKLTLAHRVQKLFTTPYYRVYASVDVLGWLNLGENTQAMLITRGLNEVARLGAAHGADPLSVAGLAGLGDLVASCSSPLSRNRTFGEALGRGGTMEYARAHVPSTVEGVASAGAVVELAHRVGVEVPVIEAVADVVNGSISPVQALERLMEISTRAEEFIQ